jgi:hypothetical protein
MAQVDDKFIREEIELLQQTIIALEKILEEQEYWETETDTTTFCACCGDKVELMYANVCERCYAVLCDECHALHPEDCTRIAYTECATDKENTNGD